MKGYRYNGELRTNYIFEWLEVSCSLQKECNIVIKNSKEHLPLFSEYSNGIQNGNYVYKGLCGCDVVIFYILRNLARCYPNDILLLSLEYEAPTVALKGHDEMMRWWVDEISEEINDDINEELVTRRDKWRNLSLHLSRRVTNSSFMSSFISSFISLTYYLIISSCPFSATVSSKWVCKLTT